LTSPRQCQVSRLPRGAATPTIGHVYFGQEIFRVHLQKLRPSRLREFDLGLLARHSIDYGGAEIEQAIVEAMRQAFSSGSTGNRSDFNTEYIIRALEETVPLATIATPQIEALKHRRIA
jgi:SpoVK/Ycf46/Vps4 family AAA+-type ATPase